MGTEKDICAVIITEFHFSNSAIGEQDCFDRVAVSPQVSKFDCVRIYHQKTKSLREGMVVRIMPYAAPPPAQVRPGDEEYYWRLLEDDE